MPDADAQHAAAPSTPAPAGPANIIAWILQVALAAAFLFMGALPKLTGDPMAQALFTELGAEPTGRFAVGTVELLVAILLLVPKASAIGAVLAIGTMLGSLLSHVAILGFSSLQVEGLDDPIPMGMMAGMAVLFAVLASSVAFIRRSNLPIVGKRLAAI